MPDISKADGVVELHYGKNVKSNARKLNTENLITKLYAYGSYGDDVSGYCGIDEIEYRVANITLTNAVAKNQAYYFSVLDEAGIEVTYCFVSTDDLSKGTVLKFSMLDYASMMYLWNNELQKAYRVSSEISGIELPCSVEYSNERNYFSFIMNFDYYNKVGQLTDEAVQAIAEYQVNGQVLKKNILDKTTEMNDSQLVLSETIGNVDFCKLNVISTGFEDSYRTITISGNPDDVGVIYRTDYGVLKKDRFEWRTSKGVKPTGESLNEEASVMYVVHNTSPVTWEKVYLKDIVNNEDNTVITLWAEEHQSISVNDRFYLFAMNNVNGYFGAYETADESCKITLENAVKQVTTNHPVYFSTLAPIISEAELNGYGWWVKYYENSLSSELYFCYSAAGDNGWNRVYCSNTAPVVNNGTYWFNWETATQHFCINNVWNKVVISEEKPAYDGDYRLYFNTKLVESFSPVYSAMLTRDKYYKGQYDTYTVSLTNTVSSGNYYLADKYGTYFLFTTDRQLNSGDSVAYNTTESHVVQKASGVETILEAKAYRFDNVKYHAANVISAELISSGTLDSSGVETENAEYNRTGFIPIYPGEYTISNASSLIVQSYSKGNQLISSMMAQNSFVVGENTAYIRITGSVNDLNDKTIVRHLYQGNSVIADKTTYVYIGNNVGGGELKGLVPLMAKFAEYADQTYEVRKAAVDAAQKEFRTLECDMIDKLGDIYREGYWQTEEYVEGDESKLYDDALENLKELAKPDASYTVSFLDLYGSAPQSEQEETESVTWPDLSIMSAAHLVDPDIDVNLWAYFDKIAKCYDQPKKTTITINTNLTTMGQHSFTDVLAHIAEVAGEVKGKETLYSRASAITSSGQMAAERLEGKIDANKLRITGGSSTWYTDSRGNQVFESSDGLSAMTLTGNGFAIANSKNIWGEWNWRTFGTGEGFNADEIIAGYLSAERIEAGTITTDHLSSMVGSELNISSNKAQNIFATIDGRKPAGSVQTNGSIIEIATDHVNIGSSGEINMTGSNLNLTGSGSINVSGQSAVNIASDGKVDINGGTIDVRSNGKINLSGGTLSVTANGIIEVVSGSAIKIGTGTLKTALDDKYSIFSGVDIGENGVTVSGKTISQLTASGVTGVITLGSDQNKLTSAGVLSLAGGNILLDGPNNTATIGNGGGTVNIGTAGNGTINIGTGGTATINLATYNIKSSTKSVAYDTTYSVGGTASTANSTNTITYTKTDDDGTTSATSFTITAQYKSATITSNANPSITNGKLLQLMYQTKGLNMYADVSNNRTILAPSVADGNLLGWNVISAVNIGATNMSAATICADNMYLNGIAVADQKWTIDTIAHILNNNDVIPSIKSRADSAYWGAYRKPVLTLTESNGTYSLTVKTAGGESEAVNFNSAASGSLIFTGSGTSIIAQLMKKGYTNPNDSSQILMKASAHLELNGIYAQCRSGAAPGGNVIASIDCTSIYNEGKTEGKTEGANSLVFYAGGYSEVANLDYGESVSITATTTRGDNTSNAIGILVKAPEAPADGYNAGWNACRDAATSLTVYTISEYPPSTLYIQVNGTYTPAGSGWCKVSRYYNAYELPDAK